MEGNNDNASAFTRLNAKQVSYSKKKNFLNQAESFMPESLISQLNGNAGKKTRK